MNEKQQKISIILPCLNEENGIKIILPEIFEICNKYKYDYEIILSDNNSTDNSVNVFKALTNELNIYEKTKIITELNPGYGITYLSGFRVATGEIILMADSDGTYNFNHIPDFINKIEEGYDLVIGNRFSGNMNKKAMPWLNKFLGNPVLSFLVRLFFKTKVKDVHCGMRAIKYDAYKKMNLYTKGMEFASEMIIQASKKNLKVAEINIEYRNRIGHSKLKAFRDGWKHLRFILIYSPYYIFIFPGILLFTLGIIFTLLNVQQIISAAIIVLGYQMSLFGVFNKFYAINHLGDEDIIMNKLVKFLTLEKMMLSGFAILLISIISFIYINNYIISVLFLNLSMQTIFSSFMISIIGIKEK